MLRRFDRVRRCDDWLLLGRKASWAEGRYSCLAGKAGQERGAGSGRPSALRTPYMALAAPAPLSQLLGSALMPPHGIPASLAAGFAEVGETLEQAVAREVMEESGGRPAGASGRLPS